MANAAQLVASSKMFGGAVQQFVHASRSTKTPLGQGQGQSQGQGQGQGQG